MAKQKPPHRNEHRWVRLPPPIQVEGGCYTLADAVRLVRAIEELIAIVG